MLTLFLNEVREQVLRDFKGYNRKEKNESNVVGMILSNDGLDGLVAIELHGLVER